MTLSTNFVDKLSFLSDALLNTTKLKWLNLFHNKIDGQEISKWIKAMSGAPTLQLVLQLCFWGNHIMKIWYKSICAWLKGHMGSNIQRLDLQDNDLNNYCIKILAKVWLQTTSSSMWILEVKLKYLQLDGHYLSRWPLVVELLTDHVTQLVSLDLSYNSLNDAGAAMLNTFLWKMSTLVSFNLSGNCFITSLGWCALADLLKPTIASKLNELTVLDLEGAQSNNDVVICYFNAVADNGNLEKMFFLG